MTFSVIRHSKSPYNVATTPWGVFTNLWPTEVSRRDRKTCGVCYLDIHAFGRTFSWYWMVKRR